MKKLFFVSALALMFVGCNCNKQKCEADACEQAAEQQVTATPEGAWRLTDYAGESEIAFVGEDADYVLTLNEDGSFGMTTDCNSMGGQYVVSGDSITFHNIATTLMACPEEEVQTAMARILPGISTYAVFGDTLLQLRSDARIMAQFAAVKANGAE